MVLRRGNAVETVVGGHDGPWPCLAHDVFEGTQVDLPQRAFVDVGAGPHPLVFLVVRGEVLDRGAGSPPLKPAHPCRAHPAAQERVLGEVLEVASTARIALDVDAGSEQYIGTAGTCLGAEGFADSLDELGIPGLSERGGRREAGGGIAGSDPHVVDVPGLVPYAVRAVFHHGRREAGGLLRHPERGSAAERCLLLQAQCADEGVDVDRRVAHVVHDSASGWVPRCRCRGRWRFSCRGRTSPTAAQRRTGTEFRPSPAPLSRR